jgi:Holliday junction resolvase RusA-like endonuclease
VTELFLRISGAPKGKGRPRSRVILPRGAIIPQGKAAFVQLYTDGETRAYEEAVGYGGRLAMNRAKLKQPMEWPLDVTVVAYHAIPEGWPSWKRQAALDGIIRPTTKPDFDNVAKAVCDGLNAVAWTDDCYIVEQRTVKLYGAKPCVEVFIETMDECAPMQITKRSQLPNPAQGELLHAQEYPEKASEEPNPF